MATTFAPREITLRDGRVVCVRAILPDDQAEILQAFGRMGPEARYMRFMAAKKSVDEQRLHDVLESFPEKGMMIAATVPAPDGIDIVGSATFLLIGEESCEFAISVLESYARTGLGRKLMEMLIEAAAARGLAEMKGFVLAANAPMLGLAQRVGFKVARDPEDFSVRIVTRALA